MNRKQLSVLVVFLLLAVTTITVYALITIDGNVTTDAAETEWASASCSNDAGGANDNGGGARVDLTRACVYEGEYYAPGNIYLYWNWDNSSFTIATEACALFGNATNGVPDDANANYALCGTVNGNPSTLTSATLYSCDNSSAISCGTPAVINTPNCAVAVNGNDPFQVGNDTTIECQIPITDIGANTVTQNRAFLDVCDPGGQDCLNATVVPLAIHLASAGASSGNGLILLTLVFSFALVSLFAVRRHRTI